ncbi:MAG: hypothetical protein JW888_11790, partial [Pirellulales bacterium]|nr:hypothetical protein [Pirellulales bacterium]
MVDSTTRWLRRCRFEQMEPRQLLAADILAIQVGAVYLEDLGYDDAGGDDSIPDQFEVTFEGGAEGTQLTELIIETDKNVNDQRDDGECFFDIQQGGDGVFGWVDLAVVEHDGFAVTGMFVEDGGDTLRMTFSEFHAGETLVFTIDVDEQAFGGASSLAEGIEFQGSRLVASFEADHYETADGMDVFFDKYDKSTLNLPPDEYVSPPAESLADRTAGAIFSLEQTPLPITISGTVFEDNNLNVHQDTNEPGLGGVGLTLHELVDGQYVPTGTATTTDVSGYYEFNGLLPGTYRIVETQPAGYLSVGAAAGTVDGVARGDVFNSDVIIHIMMEGGEDSIHNDFAEVRPASLSGHVYHDANDDGFFNGSETGIDDASIQVKGAGQDSINVTTDADGYWQVGNLMPGKYRVAEVTPDGYLDGTDREGTLGGVAQNPGDLIDGVVLSAGDAGENYDFGELLPGGLCGYVYVDADNDGWRDNGEDGIAGVELTLLNADGEPAGRVAVTDETGHYCFPDLTPGTYGIAETHPGEYADGIDREGTLGGTAHNPGDRIDAIVVGSGEKGTENNFGERLLVGISGYVYVDTNNDGFKDTGEAGIENVELELLNAQGKPTGLLTTTDDAGHYEFLGLTPGIYG